MAVTTSSIPFPPWQCVLIAWGDRYPVDEINLLVRTVLATSRGPERFLLLSDRPRPGLSERLQVRPIPEWFLKPEFLTRGCQAKLCMFEAGVVPGDMVAVYLDLDTMVLGDLSRLVALMDQPGRVALLQSAVLPFGAFARWLFSVTGGRRYARGNSSVVVYHPGQTAYIAARFRALHAQHGNATSFRPMLADERFMSWAAQPHVRAVPSRMAVKFPTEYMQPWRWLVHLRASLPWIRRRRQGLIAVTFPGSRLKGEELAQLPEGAEVVDRKGRRLIWTDRALGGLRARIIAHYGSPTPQVPLTGHPQQAKPPTWSH